jgi:Tfp pilus assembly protein PilX
MTSQAPALSGAPSGSLPAHRAQAPGRWRGAASLAVLLVMLFAMTVMVAYANRALIFEQRTSANQYRATLAFEAAESGLEWAIALLNRGGSVDAACAPVDAASGVPFRERMLTIDVDTAAIATAGRSAACTNVAGTVACDCPDAGDPAPADPGVSAYVPTHRVSFEATGQPGTVRVVSEGCTSAAQPCVAGAAETADGTARVETVVGLVSALARPPVAAVTAKGNINASDDFVAINADSLAGGITYDAGGTITVEAGSAISAPGTPAQASTVAQDRAFRDSANNPISDEAMFVRIFGMSKATFQSMPGVKVVNCAGTCDGADLVDATEGGAQQLLWLQGGLDVNSSVAIGSLNRPLLVVVDGTVRLRGGASFFGLLYSTAATWNNGSSGSGGVLRGAAVAEGDFTASGEQVFQYDAFVLDQLATRTGVFTRVPGSWRDRGN